MAVPTGLSASLGLKKETTFGTYVAPTLWLPFDSETLSRQQSYSNASGGLRGGRTAPLIGLHKQTTRSASGDFTLKFQNKGMGSILDQLHGNTVTPEKIGSGTAYKQVHKLGENGPTGKSRTLQIGKPDVTGTVQAFSYVGSKVTSLALSVATGGELMSTVSINARDEVTAETLAAPSYATGIAPFLFTQGEVSVGADALGLVGSCDLTIPIALKTDRFGLNKSALAEEPLGPNDWFQPTGSMSMEFKGLTQYNHFANNDEAKITLLFEGGVISESNKETLKIEAPACHFLGASPNVSGPELIQVTDNFSVFDNGTEAPITITYISSDTTIA